MPSHCIVRSTPDGSIEITPISTNRFRISVKAQNPETYIERDACETSFPLELIDYLIEKYPFGSLCSWTARQEDPKFIRIIRTQLLTYFRPQEFEGKRLLDFGCGSGASTFAIASMLPKTEIVGVDLGRERIDVAKKIAEWQKVSNVRFLLSPLRNSIPSDMGTFDFITLNAVYEHLLPDERKTLMPLLWAIMKPGAVLLINQTPYRYFPYEHHSTGLWMINYLPDRVAHYLARKFARINPKMNRSEDWNVLLRGGIRGATEREIIRNLVSKGGGKATILQPSLEGVPDRASYWLATTNSGRFQSIKRLIAWFFRLCDRYWGTVPSLNVDVAIRKGA